MKDIQNIILAVPCDILELEIELIPQGFNPNLDAFGILTHRNKNLGEYKQLPKSLITRLMRKGFVAADESLHLPSDSQIMDSIAGDELIQFIGMHHCPKLMTLHIVRERLYGSLLTAKVLHSQPSNLGKIPVITNEPNIPEFSQEDAQKTDILSLLKPYQAQLSRLLDVDYHSVPKRVNLSADIKVESAVVECEFWSRENKDGDQRWIPSSRNCPLSKKLIAKHPLLKNTHQESKISNGSGLTSEFEILNRVRVFRELNFRDNEQLAWQEGVLLAHEIGLLLKQYNEELNQKDNNRLQYVEPVVGTEQQQWDAAERILFGAEKDVLILSAFSNIQCADSIKDRIDSVSESRETELNIHMRVGEPDRINEADYIDRTNRFAEKLGVTVHPTTTPSHAKFVISDTGMFWIGSCNLLSSTPGSWNAEVGVFVDDSFAAVKLLQLVAPWFRSQDQKVIERITSTLSIRNSPEHQKRDFCLTIAESLSKFTIPEEDSKSTQKTEKKRLFSLIKEAMSFIGKAQKNPNYSFLLTEQHRSFLIDNLAIAERNISLASDQLRPNGLDLTLENLIVGKFEEAVAHENQRFDFRIFWGRQFPKKEFQGKDILAGQELLQALRKKIRKVLKRNPQRNCGSFSPNGINGPMGNHAKFLIVDSRRVLITSLNLTGGKSEEFDSLDATELGLAIDSPFLANVIQGEMDLMMPQGFNPMTPPFHLIVDCFAAVMITTLIDIDEPCSIESLLGAFFERVMETPHLLALWNSYMQRIKIENSVQQAIKILKVVNNRGDVVATSRKNPKDSIRIERIHAEMKKEEYTGDLNEIIVSLLKPTLSDDTYQLLPTQRSDSREDSIAEIRGQKPPKKKISLRKRPEYFNPFAKSPTAKREMIPQNPKTQPNSTSSRKKQKLAIGKRPKRADRAKRK